jgi:hypothetical protein
LHEPAPEVALGRQRIVRAAAQAEVLRRGRPAARERHFVM